MTTTFDPAAKSVNCTLSGGNLTASTSTAANENARATAGVTTGKWYWEFTLGSAAGFNCPFLGIANASMSYAEGAYLGQTTNGYAYQGGAGNKYHGAGGVAYGATFTTGDVIGMAFDTGAGTLEYFKNGVSQGVAFTGIAAGPWYAWWTGYGSTTSTATINFGATSFAHSPPVGFTGQDGGPNWLSVVSTAPKPLLLVGDNGVVKTLPKIVLITGSNGMVLTAPKPTIIAAIPIYGILATAPKPTAVITSTIGSAISVRATAPKPAFAGLIIPSATIQAILTAPAPHTASYGVNGEALTVVAAAPAPALVATMSSPIVIGATLRAPASRLSAQVLTGNIATILARAVAPVMAAAGHPAYTITMALTAPAARLYGEIDNAVAANYRTWVLNLRKGVLTEYGAWTFNSFANFNGKVLACGSGGVVELGTQAQDGTTAISARIRTGRESFGSSLHKRVPRIYMGGDTDGDLYFRVLTPEQGTRTYLLGFNGSTELQQRRVPIGKGIRGRYFQFEVENINGSDFGVDDLLVYPVNLRRRVM